MSNRYSQAKFEAFVALVCFGGIALTVFLLTLLDGEPGPFTKAVRTTIAEVQK